MNKNVQQNCTITYTVNGKEYDTVSDLEKAINNLTSTTTKITYKVAYELNTGEIITKTASRNVTIE